MPHTSDVFERTYRHYLAKIHALDLASLASRLGARLQGEELVLAMFGRDYRVSERGISGPDGNRPSIDTCVIISRYLIMCPEGSLFAKEWTAYRDFRDAGPLVGYFSTEVEYAIAAGYSGRLVELQSASDALGGYPPEIDAAYDVAVRFDALPRLPLLLLFNDADREFAAICRVLFERRAERYLDAECLAMVGRRLAVLLNRASKPISSS